jgi:hypothetical protein
MMEMRGSFLDSHFSFNYEDQENLINFLKDYYSLEELYSLCRLLLLNKDDIFTQYVPKRINCENFVDSIKQKNYVGRLFLLLQTEKFYRDTLTSTFPTYQLEKPTAKSVLTTLGEKVFQGQSDTVHISNHEGWIQQCKDKMILVLGKDSPEQYLEELRSICDIVKNQGYEPILIKQQNEIETISNEEKMLAYASLSRFIIIEKSYAAGQIDEAKICAINRFPSIWLQKDGLGDTWMQGDYESDFKFIKIFKYSDTNLNTIVDKGIQWVESFIRDKKDYLNETYPWR